MEEGVMACVDGGDELGALLVVLEGVENAVID